jgi:hypothetical protein
MAVCQPTNPYPTSRVLDVAPLDSTRRALVEKLLFLPSRDKERPKIKEALCLPQIVKADPPKEAAVKAALAITETDMTVELAFKKNGLGRATEAEAFSVYYEFNNKAVMIRPTLPRFNSDARGVWVPFPFNMTRPYWAQGKRGSDLLFLIPEGTDCAVQSVVVCPRTFVAPSKLATTGYSPVGVRYLVSGKADGLFALGQRENGRVQASLLTTPGIEMPETWFRTQTNSTPSATIKFSTPRLPGDTPPPFINGTVPMMGAIEARLDFGSETESMRTIRSRSVVEVSEVALPESYKATVRESVLKVEGGACYLITRWKEQYL